MNTENRKTSDSGHLKYS